jgi:hypothetical protein
MQWLVRTWKLGWAELLSAGSNLLARDRILPDLALTGPSLFLNQIDVDGIHFPIPLPYALGITL